MYHSDRKNRSDAPTAQMESPMTSPHENRFATPVAGLPTTEDEKPHA